MDDFAIQIVAQWNIWMQYIEAYSLKMTETARNGYVLMALLFFFTTGGAFFVFTNSSQSE